MTKIKIGYVNQEELLEFEILHEISEILSSSLDLKRTLRSIFEVLDKKMGLDTWLLLLFDPYEDELLIEKKYGICEESVRQKKIKKWKEVAKTALNKKKVLVIPNIDNKMEDLEIGHEEELGEESFICIPIILSEQKIGTISVNCPFKSGGLLHRTVKLLSVISLMVGQEIRLKQLMEKEKEILRDENVKLKEKLIACPIIDENFKIKNMIGKSNKMHQLFESIQQVSNSNATVLIRGESGTGKELAAQAIHYNSNRSKHPFVRINCGAIPENLIETELFGYEKGAFTDAAEQRKGKFELAAGGTIFLDEIGELPLMMQVKLLHVLQEKKFHRIGGDKDIKAEVRIITATHRNLEKDLKEGRFREDLYYRLNVFPIFLPPLRERRADILLLINHFVEKFGKENNKKITRIDGKVIESLSSYDWPGNVRELQNCIERAIILCNDSALKTTHLPPSLQKEEGKITVSKEASFTELVDQFQEGIIIEKLKETNGNISHAAQELKTTMRILHYKIKQYNINYKDFR